MKKYFTIGEAAKSVYTTSETLRHYDRIGLVKPSQKDSWTNYRYYSEQDIVRLHTVRALQKMDLSLRAIQQVLEYDDLNKVVDFLAEAEKRADDKIAELQYCKHKIQAAKADYQSKLKGQSPVKDGMVKRFPKRVILLSDQLETPTLENLWDYLRHFYDQIAPEQREQFAFEDLAGIYTENGISRLFAVCIRYRETAGLVELPKGDYLCAVCTEENRAEKTEHLLRAASMRCGTKAPFAVQQIMISGILHWNYQIQVYLPEEA